MRIVLLVLGLLVGCEDQRPPPPGRGAAGAEPRGTAQGAAQPADPSHAPGKRRRAPTASPRAGGPSRVRAEPRSARPPAPGDETNDEPARDLGAELHAAIGDPTPCLPSDQEALPSRLTIAVQAHLSLTGVVTRAEVRVPELSDAARRCIRDRVQDVRLPGPIPDAPRSVRTTLTLER